MFPNLGFFIIDNWRLERETRACYVKVFVPPFEQFVKGDFFEKKNNKKRKKTKMLPKTTCKFH